MTDDAFGEEMVKLVCEAPAVFVAWTSETHVLREFALWSGTVIQAKLAGSGELMPGCVVCRISRRLCCCLRASQSADGFEGALDLR